MNNSNLTIPDPNRLNSFLFQPDVSNICGFFLQNVQTLRQLLAERKTDKKEERKMKGKEGVSECC